MSLLVEVSAWMVAPNELPEMRADTDNLNEPKPKRPLGWAGIAVGLLLLVAIGFTNAWCHPRARLMREVKQVKRGDTQAAVEARMKTVAVLRMSYYVGTNEAAADDFGLDAVANRRVNWWHLFCPEFPFIEQLRQSQADSSETPDSRELNVLLNFKGRKAVSFSTDNTVTPFSP